MSDAPSRRSFLATSLTAASYNRVPGANDRVGIGFIGYGLIGAAHVADFKNQKDADLVAVSDTYQPRIEAGRAACGPPCKGYTDFRRLLEDKDIQAVCISTPDHWHALMTMLACAASKDVYVEKPLTLFVREGRWMVNAARKYGRVVQVGTQQRSGKHYQEARKLLGEGRIGKVHSVRFASFRNVMPGFGRAPESAPPPNLDYDMWLGPAPQRAYTAHRSLYHFRWFWDYSGGQMTNLGVHDLDIVHWAMRVPGPRAVSSMGGRYALEDDGETPDTQDALFEYPGFTMALSLREASAGHGGGGFEFCGTKGILRISRSGFEVVPDMRIHPANAIPNWSNPPGHPPRSDAPPVPWTDAVRMRGSSEEQMDLHVRNFLDCVKSRGTPIATVEDGHRVATACHLANISLRLGRMLRWDAEKEEIIGDREADGWLVRPYRRPWDGVPRSIGV